MKYLAILSDSLREALDSKVLYFTVGLSALVILAIASISFQPQPAEKGLEIILRQFPGGQTGIQISSDGSQGSRAALRYQMRDFQQENETTKPWEGKYHFQLVAKEDPKQKGAFRMMVWLLTVQPIDVGKLTEEDLAAMKRAQAIARQAQGVQPDKLKEFLTAELEKEVARVSPRQMERFVQDQLAMQGTFEATHVQLAGEVNDEYVFNVQAQPKDGAFLTWPHTLYLFFGAFPISEQASVGRLVWIIEDQLVSNIGAAVTMLLSVVITAFFIPNMMRKGTIDLLLAKPIHRTGLLIYKFIGGLSFMFLNTVIVVVGIWLVLGVRSGLWAPAFLLVILILTFQFAIFYAVSALFGVLTRSPIVAILAACFTWALLWVASLAYGFTETAKQMGLELPQWVNTTVDTVHFVLPRYKDFDVLTGKLLTRDLLPADNLQRKITESSFTKVNWGESLTVSGIFIGLMMGLACWRFSTRDY